MAAEKLQEGNMLFDMIKNEINALLTGVKVRERAPGPCLSKKLTITEQCSAAPGRTPRGAAGAGSDGRRRTLAPSLIT